MLEAGLDARERRRVEGDGALLALVRDGEGRLAWLDRGVDDLALAVDGKARVFDGEPVLGHAGRQDDRHDDLAHVLGHAQLDVAFVRGECVRRDQE